MILRFDPFELGQPQNISRNPPTCITFALIPVTTMTSTQTASPSTSPTPSPTPINLCAAIISLCSNVTAKDNLSPKELKCCDPTAQQKEGTNIELLIGAALLVLVCTALIPVVFSYLCWRRNNFLASKKRVFAVNLLVVFLSILLLLRSIAMMVVRHGVAYSLRKIPRRI
jgi:hypothetical protein